MPTWPPEAVLRKLWLRPGRATNEELDRALNAKLRSLGFPVREAGSRWKDSSRGVSCPSKDHRNTEWRWLNGRPGAQLGAWSSLGEGRKARQVGGKSMGLSICKMGQ